MDVFGKVFLIGSLLALSTPNTAGQQRCNGGVECIKLEDCTGLYSQLRNGASVRLTQLLRGLHCGFNGNQPMICCPPEFQTTSFNSITTTASPNRNGWNTNNDWNRGTSPNTNGGWGGNTNSNGDSLSGSSSSDRANLLPDRRTCGIQNNDRIVGGTRADLDEHPWMALLRYDKRGEKTNFEIAKNRAAPYIFGVGPMTKVVQVHGPSHSFKAYGWGFYCGGVLISSRYVLTAAHCVKGQDLPTNWRLSQVRLGEWNTTSARDCVMDDCAEPVQDIAIEEIIAHKEYDPKGAHQHNDIALLRLAQPAQFNDFVKPICLPLTSDLKNNGFDGFNMEVAGWGKTQTRSESDVKLKVEVPVVSRAECSRVFNTQGRVIIDKQLCAGGVAGKDSCRGDSGGPLMGRIPSANNWFAFGVVSYGPSPCGYPGWPGVYTRVGAYVNWILSKIRP